MGLFSQRLSWDSQQNELSRVAAQRREEGRAMLDLTVSNPSQVELAYPQAELFEALGRALTLDYRPESQGLPKAREAVAQYYADRGRVVDADDIFICCSTSEAYSWLFKLLADPNDFLLIPTPTYPLFEHLAALENLRARYYPSLYDGTWRFDQQAFEDAWLPSCKAILAVSPANPTGACLGEEDWQFLSASGSPVIVDEVFADYPATGEFAPSCVGRHDCLNFVLSGLSKVCALPGLKLGWIVVQGPDELRQEAKSRLEWIADTYLSAATPVQHALPELLHHADSIQAVIRERVAHNRRELAQADLRTLQSDGGWYGIVEMPEELDDQAWAQKLLHAGFLVHPGHFYDMPQHSCIVVSLLTPPETLAAGVRKMGSLT